LNSAVENLSKYLKHTPNDKKARNDLERMKGLLNRYK